MAAKQHACLANNSHEPELTRRPRLLAPPVRNRHFRCTMDLWPRTIPQHRRRRGVRHSGSGQRPRQPRERSIPAQAGEPHPRACGPCATRVYPRAGGGTEAAAVQAVFLSGLSPRRRGNQDIRPEWSSSRSGHRVYPRAGGGTKTFKWNMAPTFEAPGLSPRRRGNHSDGKGPLAPCCPWGLSPRRRGNLIAGIEATSSWPMVYPRAGGGTYTGRVPLRRPRAKGLSPRRRGNRRCSTNNVLRRLRGSIPAQAGEPRPCARMVVSTSTKVYPRAGGGTVHAHGRRILRVDRSIPAQAGEPCQLSMVVSTGQQGVYPRAGGGTQKRSAAFSLTSGLSPRRRGNRYRGRRRASWTGSIPAQAGEPRAAGQHRSPYRVYPRAGGGTGVSELVPILTSGLSPRRRGNQFNARLE